MERIYVGDRVVRGPNFPDICSFQEQGLNDTATVEELHYSEHQDSATSTVHVVGRWDKTLNTRNEFVWKNENKWVLVTGVCIVVFDL